MHVKSHMEPARISFQPSVYQTWWGNSYVGQGRGLVGSHWKYSDGWVACSQTYFFWRPDQLHAQCPGLTRRPTGPEALSPLRFIPGHESGDCSHWATQTAYQCNPLCTSVMLSCSLTWSGQLSKWHTPSIQVLWAFDTSSEVLNVHVRLTAHQYEDGHTVINVFWCLQDKDGCSLGADGLRTSMNGLHLDQKTQSSRNQGHGMQAIPAPAPNRHGRKRHGQE